MSGCTSFRDYVRNGFKVGPEYCKPAAPVAEQWIDAPEISSQRGEELSRWWTVFQDPVLKQPDPVLNHLVQTAYRQNLTLRQAGTRILQARAQLGIAKGSFFPQQQSAFGDYTRSGANATGFSDSWDFGFRLNWELDFWGRFRRAIIAANRDLDASVEGYDFALITLLGDVASNYVQIRSDQEQIRLVQENVELQKTVVVNYLRPRAKVGFGKDVQVDKDQGESTLANTQAGIPQLEIDLRQANDRLCVLLGVPAVNLREAMPLWKAVDERKAEAVGKARDLLRQLLAEVSELDPESLNPEDRAKLDLIISPIYIPTVPVPEQVAIGIPADLLRRRPDVRRAERLAAAQGEQIGIAESDLYPAFSLTGNLGYQADTFQALFSPQAFNGRFGLGFNWNILNYGRIVNNVRFQDARFQELVLAYQNTVLLASQEVEDGLVTFLRSDERREMFWKSVIFLIDANRYMTRQLAIGQIDVNRYNSIAQNLVGTEVSWASAQNQIAQGLIAVYRALGGGWEIRLGGAEPPPPGAIPNQPEPEGPAGPALPALPPAPELPDGMP